MGYARGDARFGGSMTRYWAIRTNQARRPFFWRELQAGRVRQGSWYRDELDLEMGRLSDVIGDWP
jgi:hypothetical protein